MLVDEFRPVSLGFRAMTNAFPKLAPKPPGMRCLDDLAWTIGRDDRIAGLPPFIRSRDYRPDKRRWYRLGYLAQGRLPN
jgi:hypothetical protein